MTNPPLSDYERLRAERIQRNNARLESLGLLNKPKFKTTPIKKRSISTVVTPSPSRASQRVKRHVKLYQPSFDDYSVSAKAEKRYEGVRVAKYFDGNLFMGTITGHDMENDWFTCVYDDGDREDFTSEELLECIDLYTRKGKILDEKVSFAIPKREKVVKSKFRCEIPDKSSSPLSAKQKKIISDTVGCDFLEHFEEYLTSVDEVSESNRRNVLRQISKLANGEGIRYDSKAYGWPEGCYFMKGIAVSLHDDIRKLMDIGQQCEDEWGRDHGNGWLLSHPLKKLYMFQQYCLTGRSVQI